jgi:hypothetical protein
MSEYTERQAQADADALVARLKDDPEFVVALRSDPRAALVSAGLPEVVVNDLVSVLTEGSDVEGFTFAETPGHEGITADCPGMTRVFSLPLVKQSVVCCPASVGVKT